MHRMIHEGHQKQSDLGNHCIGFLVDILRPLLLLSPNARLV
jgi:hypothetical protein